MGTGDILLSGGGGGGDPGMDKQPVLSILHAKEIGISSGHLCLWFVCTFTLPFIFQ